MSKKARFRFVQRFLQENGNDATSDEAEKEPENEEELKKRTAPVSASDSKLKNRAGIQDKNVKDTTNDPICLYCESRFVVADNTANRIKLTCEKECGFSFVIEKLKPLGWTAIESWIPKQKERVNDIAVPSACPRCKPGTDIKVTREGNIVNFKCTNCDFNGTLDPDNGLFASTWNMKEEEVDTVRILIRKVKEKDGQSKDSGVEDNITNDIAPNRNCEHCGQIMEVVGDEELIDKDGKFTVYTLECKNSECEWIVKKGVGIHQEVRASKMAIPARSEQAPKAEPEDNVQNQETEDDIILTECSYCPAKLKLTDVEDNWIKYECEKKCGYSILILFDKPDRKLVNEMFIASLDSDTVQTLAQDMKQAVDTDDEHSDCPHCSGRLEEVKTPYMIEELDISIKEPHVFRCNNDQCLYHIIFNQFDHVITEIWELDPVECDELVKQAIKDFEEQRKYPLKEGDACPNDGCDGTLIKIPSVALVNGHEKDQSFIILCLKCNWSWSSTQSIEEALQVTAEKCPLCSSYLNILDDNGVIWCPKCFKSREQLIELKKQQDEESARKKQEQKEREEKQRLDAIKEQGRTKFEALINGNNDTKPADQMDKTESTENDKPEASDQPGPADDFADLDEQWFSQPPEDRPFDAAAVQDSAKEDGLGEMPDSQPIQEDDEPEPELELEVESVEPPPIPIVKSVSEEQKAESAPDQKQEKKDNFFNDLKDKLHRLEFYMLDLLPMLKDLEKKEDQDFATKDELLKHQKGVDELKGRLDITTDILERVRSKAITADEISQRIQSIEDSITLFREDLDGMDEKVKKRIEQKKFWQPPRVYKYIIPSILVILVFLFIFLGIPYYIVDSKVADLSQKEEKLKTTFVSKDDLKKSEQKFENFVKELKRQNDQRKINDTKLRNKIADVDKEIKKVSAQIAGANAQAERLAKIDLDSLQNQLNLLSARVNGLKTELAQYATKDDLSRLPVNQISAEKLNQMQKDIDVLKAHAQGLANVQKQQNDTIRKQHQVVMAAQAQAAKRQAAQTQPAQRPQATQSRPVAQPQPAAQPAPRPRRPYSQPAYRSRKRTGSRPLVISGTGKKSGTYNGIKYEYECYGVGCDSPLTIR